MNEVMIRERGSLAPKNFEEALKCSEIMASSDMVPKEYKGRPDNILVAMQLGDELGLLPIQACQNICIINGRPSVWGDAALALVQSSGKLEYISETDDGQTAKCVCLRRGQKEPTTRTFSIADANRAGLTTKTIWVQYPVRMRQMRARSWALRDTFADVLKGISVREEIEDIVVEAEPNTIIIEKVAPAPILGPKSTHDAAQVITDKQRNRLFAIARERGLVEDQIKTIIRQFQFESTKKITQDVYDVVIEAIQNTPLEVVEEAN